METPLPIPINRQRKISTGCPLVPTAASDAALQKLPITMVSTVIYNSCRMFPAQMGRAKSRLTRRMEPFVISIFSRGDMDRPSFLFCDSRLLYSIFQGKAMGLDK